MSDNVENIDKFHKHVNFEFGNNPTSSSEMNQNEYSEKLNGKIKTEMLDDDKVNFIDLTGGESSESEMESIMEENDFAYMYHMKRFPQKYPMEFLRKRTVGDRPIAKPRPRKKPNRIPSPPVPETTIRNRRGKSQPTRYANEPVAGFQNWLNNVRISNKMLEEERHKKAILEQEAIFEASRIRMAKELEQIRVQNEIQQKRKHDESIIYKQIWDDLCKHSKYPPHFEGIRPWPWETEPYACLGLPKDASTEQIKKRYRKLVLCFHPDKNPHGDSNFAFCAFSDAYEKLTGSGKKV